VHTVIETPAYLASARDVGLGEQERDEIVTYLARHPDAGDLMLGTGGARKLRFAGRSKGKSGGYRVVTFFRFSCSISMEKVHAPTCRKPHGMNCARC
jgi:hypothetical protein